MKLHFFFFLTISFYTSLGFGQQKGCDPKLWNKVYNEPLLQIKKSCITAKGQIYTVTNEKDGCVMLRILLDPGQEALINNNNSISHYGCLPAMIICACKAKIPEAVFSCTDFRNSIPIPERGMHVKVWGSLVQNFEHGWYEIHPVSGIEVLP